MHQIEVDERDSSWEIDKARFRVYVFMGAANAVVTTDILSATVEEALEAAWNQRWQELADADTGRGASEKDWAAWRAKGIALVARIREALNSIAEIHPAYLHTTTVA